MTGRHILALFVAASAITMLTGCGTNMEQRAATGAATGLIIAGPVGAVVGAVAGAVINEADEEN